jgi:hypothetical protein
MTLVVDTGDQWSLRGATRLDPAGNPHVTFKVGAPRPLKKGSPKKVNYFRWTGEEWVGGVPDAAMPTDAESDILISSPTRVSLLLDGSDEVAWWHSTDGGRSFAKGDVLISRERTTFAMSTIIRNAHPDARVIAAGNDKAANSLFRKLYLLGDQGPIKRTRAEADQNVD